MYEARLLAGRYRLDARIGGGGMGVVWRATDEVLNRQVAVKLMLATLLHEPDFERRFLFEARAMASVSHPGVVAVHDYRSDQQGAFLVMELIDGESLLETLRRVGRLSIGETMSLVAQAADALAAAHAQGLVHRDVKPGNLLIRSTGAIVLTDFGISRTTGTTGLTGTGEVLGTPSYLAPEQVRGEPATPLSDVYALGVVAYECLTGRRPFEAENAYGVAMKRLQEPPAPLGEDIPPAVARLILGALAREPADRWQSAGELAAAAAALAGTATPATVDGRHTRPVVRPTTSGGRAGSDPGTRRRRRRVAVAAVLVLLLAAVSGAIWATASGTLQRIDPFAQSLADGFAPCDSGPVYCPHQPLCWGGITAIGGRAQPPTAVDCTEAHPWETYAAVAMPADALTIRQDELMAKRPDIATVCSAERMTERSRDRAKTAEFRRDPWPVQQPDGAWVLHCIAGPEVGRTTGSAFKTVTG